MNSIACQGWFCIKNTCAVLQCDDLCVDDAHWFCGKVEGVTRNDGLACKRRAFFNQPCNNQTLPCDEAMTCSAVNSTCQITPETLEEYQEEVKSRRITMAGMIVVLIGMFVAMRRMLKNEEARRRQIWEPVDSSAEASILRRLAEDTQRRVTGGWGQISESLVESGNAATAAMGTAFTRIRNNVRNVTGGSSRPEDCDDTLEMLPNGRRAQTRRELEADMRDFLLEADDEADEDEDEDGHNQRDEDGLLARHRSSSSSNSIGSGNGSGSNSIHSHSSRPTGSNSLSLPQAGPGVSSISPSLSSTSSSDGFPDEPPSYDEIRPSGGGPDGPSQSIAAGLSGGRTGSDTLV
ncbi:hypothetical protein BGZ83_008936 [Gryganskiella cystojenkinii]|nr:hypothetical protein BGZ83_008936 [Gryganskiella cystojenkinii]